MTTSAKNILVTGMPGSGKTTLIAQLAQDLRGYGPVGFTTEEMRERGARTGFRLKSLDGKRTGVLAHVEIEGPHRVGHYGVDLKGFERVLGALPFFSPAPRLVIIDEIGRMECLSARFRDLVLSCLDAPAPFIATIALKAGGFTDEVKGRQDVCLYEVTEKNRESLLRDLASHVRSLLKA